MPETVQQRQEVLMGRLQQKLAERPQRLAQAKQDGRKVVGYFCPHVPEELILAAGMIPLRLAFGGELSASSAGEEFLKSSCCPYTRACTGYRLEGKNEYYNLVDAICVAQTCENMRHTGEYWQSYFGVPVFNLGLTHTHTASRSRPQALKYFKEELELLRMRLGKFAGREVRDSDIRKAIGLCNAVRETLRILYEYPREYSPAIEWYDVFHIMQAGFLLDKGDYLVELKAIERQLSGQPPVTTADNGIRLMIAGSLIGIGDNKILDIVRKAGGNIVVDSLCTGSMLVRKNVTIFGIMGSPMDALAERYLYNIPCPCMTDLSKRLGRLIKLARDYRATGLIYYTLKDCDTWRGEYPLIKDYLYGEQMVPSLLIESDYSSSDVGAIKTKVEAFLELIGGIR